jgi:hypothetical protein
MNTPNIKIFAIVVITLLSSCTVLTQQTNKTKDIEFAIKEVEENYAGFLDKTSSRKEKKAYEKMKKRVLNDIATKNRESIDGVAEYMGWFNDVHLRTSIVDLTNKYCKSEPSYDECEYNPAPTAKKVDDKTFLIRFPSCEGYPTIEWSEKAVNSFLSSGCENLILDIRGNGGGRDDMYSPYLHLLYDTPAYIDGVAIRNTPEHIKYMEGISNELPWVREVIDTMKASKEEFVTIVTGDTISRDTISPLPLKAALIVDGNVASSGEQLTIELQACSKRTKIYGRDNTLGCLDYSNIRDINLPVDGVTIWIPMTRSERCPNRGIDKNGITPDIRIPLPLPKKLTDNVDEWSVWIAEDMKK